MKTKIIALALVVAMFAVAAIGSTLAYFTDSAEAENVFTVGSVDIELLESTLHRAGAYGGNGEATDDEIIADAEGYQDWLADQPQLMPGVAINKMPYVNNIGDSAAYVRIRVLIPSVLDLDCLNSSVICTSALENEFSRPAGVSDYAVDSYVTIDGVDYDVYTFIRDEALEAGEMTYWNVWNTIRMDEDTTMDDYNRYVAAGAIDQNGQFKVLVQADAIQAATFADATAAFEAFDAQ